MSRVKFDLEKALSGEKIVTRDGREIDQLHIFHNNSGSILYGYDTVNDHVEQWLIDGRYHDTKGECGADIFMAPKQLSGFVNVYNNTGEDDNFTVHSERRYADKVAGSLRVACIDLSQFEEGHGLD